MAIRGIYVILWVILLTTSALLSNAYEIKVTPRCGAVGEDRPLVPDPANQTQLIPAKGDFYNRTRCFCRRLEGTPDNTTWDGNYFHISYFSQSQARRFDLEWVCKAPYSDINKEWGDTECAAKQDQDSFWRLGDFNYIGCADCGDPNSLKWCYSAQLQSGNRDQTILWIRNNPRASYLQEFGKSYTVYRETVLGVCDQVCKEKVDPNMGVLSWSTDDKFPYALNKIEYIDDAFILRKPTPRGGG